MAAVTLYCQHLPPSLRAITDALKADGVIRYEPSHLAQIGVYTHSEAELCASVRNQVRLLECSAVIGDAEFLLPQGMPVAFFQNALRQALKQVQQQTLLVQTQQQLTQHQIQSERLMDIGIALSAEQNHKRLLERILTEARAFACCDAASIFLIDDTREKIELVFKLSQNDSIKQSFTEQRFALDGSSLAGFVARTGRILNLEDVYELPENAPYVFNKSFDLAVGYRTRSMLVIPMRTNDGRIIGAIQFINCKVRSDVKLNTVEATLQYTQPFPEPLTKLLEMLASQAAVAIENNTLVERINILFEGFVQASVRAIEQRDPTTSGHSFRVADFTVALAEAAHNENRGVLAPIAFNDAQLRELRYAALLHDFGKVGVREHVLVKAKKLNPEAWVRFQYRIALQKEQVKNHFLQERLTLLKKGALGSDKEQELDIAEHEALEKLHGMQHAVELANEPTILDNGTFEHLQSIREHIFHDIDGHKKPLIEEHEFLALAVRRGSLTESERVEIESHVTHTIRFLSTIPWTPELAHVPHIAGAHHEKMDGTGYPNCLHGHDIPVGARMMAVCDIFDALTASDRPYKAAIPIAKALDILHMEANNNKIDGDLVALFSRLPLTDIVPSLKAV